MQRYFGILQDTSGNVIPTATVNVYLANGTTAATIYSDNGTTTKDNPFLTGTDGSYEFWAANGVYDIWCDLGWASRLDLAQSNAARHINQGFYVNVTVLPVAMEVR